jgi:thymidine kinase
MLKIQIDKRNKHTEKNEKNNNTNNNNNKMKTSYLEIILGCMYSGKTSKLVEIYKQCQFCNIPVAVINHSIDKRYDDNLLSTHDKVMIPCIQTNKLLDVWYYNNIDNNDNDYTQLKFLDDSVKLINADVILINEGQFFDDLYPAVKHMLQHGKQIYICGLDGDFERKRFGQILDLIPLCDKVTKLTSLCSLCKNGTPGIFSKRITSEKEQTVVGSDNYIPVCRNCYESDSYK